MASVCLGWDSLADLYIARGRMCNECTPEVESLV